MSHLDDLVETIEECHFEQWKKTGKFEVDPPISSDDLDEAWQKAYPEPKDFLKFFVQKLWWYDTQAKGMLETINKNEIGLQTQSKCYYDDNQKLHKAIDKARTEVVRVHEFIGKEREWYQKLCGNFREKELECEHWRRKYDAVCYLTKTKDRDVDHFMQKNPDAPTFIDKMRDIREEMDKYGHLKLNKYLKCDQIALGKRIEALREQVPAAQKLARERVEELQKIYNVDREKMNERITTLHEESKTATESNKELQELLNKTLTDNLELQIKLRENETIWASERKRLVKMVAGAYNHHVDPALSTSGMLESTVSNVALLRDLKEKVKRLECSLLKETNAGDRLRRDNLRLNKEVHNHVLKGMSNRDNYQNETRKLNEKIKILEKRISDDNTRRKLDGAGFREDVKHLKKTLNKLEKMMKHSSMKYSIPELLPFREPPALQKSAKRCTSAPDHCYINSIADKRLIQELKDSMTKEELALLESRNAMIRHITTAFQRAHHNIFDLYDKIKKVGM